MRKIFYFAILIFVSCSGLAIKENITGNYYLIATDTGDDCALDYHEPNDENNYAGIIGATVFAVGYNDKYIIVKQHPRVFPNPPNKEITNYFILQITDGFDWRNKSSLYGPLTLVQFNEKRKELGVPEDLQFTKIFKDLE